MKTSEAIQHYGGNVSELARAAEVDQSTVYSWGEFPPGPRQLLLQRKTKRALLAEKDCMLPKPRKQNVGAD